MLHERQLLLTRRKPIRAVKRWSAGAILVSALLPAAAYAVTVTWATNYPMTGGQGFQNPTAGSLSSVYCHELDTAHVRQIEAFAVTPTNTQYGGKVQGSPDILASGYGGTLLKGACSNPHSPSVAYGFNAHDNRL